MDAASVRKLVEAEIAGRGSEPLPHGVDLQRCLVQPNLQRFKGYPEGSPDWELWVVLEEDPVGCAGYKVAYDPEDQVFCLAYGQQPDASHVGHYGSFLAALGAM
jgi:hypothetical protein